MKIIITRYEIMNKVSNHVMKVTIHSLFAMLTPDRRNTVESCEDPGCVALEYRMQSVPSEAIKAFKLEYPFRFTYGAPRVPVGLRMGM